MRWTKINTLCHHFSLIYLHSATVLSIENISKKMRPIQFKSTFSCVFLTFKVVLVLLWRYFSIFLLLQLLLSFSKTLDTFPRFLRSCSLIVKLWVVFRKLVVYSLQLSHSHSQVTGDYISICFKFFFSS